MNTVGDNQNTAPQISRLERTLRWYHQQVFSVDSRSLSLFRVALGLVVAIGVLERMPDLHAFYSDSGVFPREAMHQYREGGWYWSLYSLSGESWWAFVLLTATLGCAIGFAFGRGWRWFAFALWILMVSVSNRNPLILNSGDKLLLLLLFWSLFLPLGRHFVLGRTTLPPVRVCGVASMAIVLQFLFLYLFTALHKTGEQWHSEYSAVWYSLSLHTFAKTPGLLLAEFPNLCAIMTFFVWWAELLVPIALLVPWKVAIWRIVAVGFSVALHGGFLVTLILGLFPLVSICLALPLLPSIFWDRLARQKKSESSGNTPPSLALPRWSETLCAGFLIVALFSNLESLPHGVFGRFSLVRDALAKKAPDSLMFHSVEAAATACQRVEQFFALHQRWKMFAPRPTRLDGWVSLKAHLADGRTLELVPTLRRIPDAPPALNKRPDSLANWYPNARWRKYFMCLFWDQRTLFHPRLGVFLAQEWNHQSPAVPVREIHAIVFQRNNALKEPVGSERRTEFLLYVDGPSQPSTGG